MGHYLTDRGIQAALTSGIVIATLAVFFAEAHRPIWVGLGIVWVATAALAVVMARRNHRRAQ